MNTANDDFLLRATAWATSMESGARQIGRVLSAAETAWATQVGVQRPGLIRIVEVGALPLPQDEALRSFAVQNGFDSTDGLTLGHAVLVVAAKTSPTLLRHEFRHVAQYERYGSINAFLADYFAQIAQYGYWNAPLERDARAFEGSAP